MLVVETGGYPREGARILKEYNGDEENPLHRVGDVAKDLQVNNHFVAAPSPHCPICHRFVNLSRTEFRVGETDVKQPKMRVSVSARQLIIA
jgi:hypothetical protein